MPFVEHATQPSASYSNMQGFRGIRFFVVWGGPTRNAVLEKPQDITNPNGDTLPEYDSVWPGGEDWAEYATLEAYDVENVDGDTLHVRAVYTDRRSRGAYEAAHQTEPRRVEYAVLEPYYYPIIRVRNPNDPPPPANPSPTPDPILAWSIRDFMLPSSWYRIRRTFYVKLNGAAAIDPTNAIDKPIANQVGRIHNIGAGIGPTLPGQNTEALWARYEGAVNVKLTWDRYMVTHSWVVDNGVKAISTADLLNNSLADEVLPEANIHVPRFVSKLYGGEQEWFLPPFETVQRAFKPATDPLRQVPPFYFTFVHNVDAEGWRQLPT